VAELGNFFVKIGSKFDDKGFKDARQAVNKVGKVFAVFAAASSAALIAVTKKASDLEETTSKFNTVFRGSQKIAEQWADALVESYGLSTDQAKRFLAATQDLLVPMGLQRQEAAKLANEVVKLSVDLGSFNNMPTEQVMRDIQSAITGMVIPMKKYGVVLSQALIKQEAMNLGLFDGVGEMTNAAKAQATLSLITKNSADAVGDFERTQESFANQTKIMTARIDDFITKLGVAFLPTMTRLVNIVNTNVLPALKDWADDTENLEKLGKGLDKILKFITTTAIGLAAVFDIAATAYANFAFIISSNAKKILTPQKSLLELLGKVKDKIIGVKDTTNEVAGPIKSAWDDIAKKVSNYGALIDNINKFSLKQTKKVEEKKTDIIKREIKKRGRAFKFSAQQEADAAKVSKSVEEEAERKFTEQKKIMLQEVFDATVEFWQKRVELVADFTSQLTDTLTAFQEFKNVQIENETTDTIDAENEKFKKRKKFIEDNVLDETERTRQLGELEQSHNAKIDNIRDQGQRKLAQQRKKLKPFLIGEAIANTALGATKALAQGGFTAGIIMAALVAAAGAARVATIKAQKFAEGGMALKPTLAEFAERGTGGEIALPLNHPNTIKALSGALAAAGGGGMGMINITVPPITSRRNAKEMGKILGKEILRGVQKSRRI
jgi:hypothetical protein